MLRRIGRRIVQGAKAEIQENPPEILEEMRDRWTDLLEMGLMVGLMTMIFFGNRRGSTKPVTVIVNNYISK